MKKRLDLQLVELGLAPSRTRAQDLIKTGSVLVDGKPAKASSQIVEENSKIEIQDSELNKYVSRGGLKLEGALDKIQLSVHGLAILDVGISTGGFTDCLLKRGAQQVVGVDVGHDQLHPSLRQEPRLILIEGVNARELDQNEQVLQNKPASGWPLIVVDVSFISLSLILPALKVTLQKGGHLLALVKPQFEVGPEGLGKGGVVKNPILYAQVEEKIRQKCLELDLTVRDYLESPIEGKDGNREFFVFAQK
ncbi:MAG: TlyA family RNA methyltransferase [Pseudobdellovibrionaceae bacterium]